MARAVVVDVGRVGVLVGGGVGAGSPRAKEGGMSIFTRCLEWWIRRQAYQLMTTAEAWKALSRAKVIR
jgi:hypothetical protein